jgi:ubiquinone/menaquinone biosynthesis C-methylase UbiE
VAELLPFADRCFDVAMSVLSDQHWADPLAGLAEMARVAAG